MVPDEVQQDAAWHVVMSVTHNSSCVRCRCDEVMLQVRTTCRLRDCEELHHVHAADRPVLYSITHEEVHRDRLNASEDENAFTTNAADKHAIKHNEWFEQNEASDIVTMRAGQWGAFQSADVTPIVCCHLLTCIIHQFKALRFPAPLPLHKLHFKGRAVKRQNPAQFISTQAL